MGRHRHHHRGTRNQGFTPITVRQQEIVKSLPTEVPPHDVAVACTKNTPLPRLQPLVSPRLSPVPSPILKPILLSSPKMESCQRPSMDNGITPARPPVDSSSSDLPVSLAKTNIVRFLRKNRICVMVGETGSGKSTLIPQFALDEIVSPALQELGSDSNRTKKKHKSETERGSMLQTEDIPWMVGVTQPRRVAASSLASYVAKCRNVDLGSDVGYAVRFDDKTSPATRLKYMTDGILLRELLQDPTLSKYAVILLDEAHERTLHGDILFGLLKRIAVGKDAVRSDLRIVIMSATLNSEQFARYWGDCEVGFVEGRRFPVKVFHTVEPQANYVDAAITTIIQVHLENAVENGDILCFLTGQDEIQDACEMMEQKSALLPQSAPKWIVRPLFAALPPQKQQQAFERAPPGTRRIIIATNIAESSLTIEGIKYVIDGGMVKERNFESGSGIDRLSVVPASKASIKQRTGRAGRVSEGKCFRMFTEEDFEDLEENTVPEILRCNLASVVLQMKAMGINDVTNFDFMDRPGKLGFQKALELLVLLEAISLPQMLITPLGMELVQFPVDPKAAKAMKIAADLGVECEVAAIIAMVGEDSPVGSDRNKTDDISRSVFAKTEGDHITVLKLFSHYVRMKRSDRSEWCEAVGINKKQMDTAVESQRQIVEISRRISRKNPFLGVPVVETYPNVDLQQSDDFQKVRRAICAGYFVHAAQWNQQRQVYSTLSQPSLDVSVHPSSVLYQQKKKPPLLIFHSMIHTSKRYIRELLCVREEWLVEYAPEGTVF